MRWSLTLYQMSGLLLTCPAWCWAALWKSRGPPRSECCPQWAWPSLMCGRCGLHLWRSHRRRPFHPCSCRCPLNWTSYCYGCWPPHCCCCWERSSEAWGCWVEMSRPRDLPTWHTTWWQTTGLIWTAKSAAKRQRQFSHRCCVAVWVRSRCECRVWAGLQHARAKSPESGHWNAFDLWIGHSLRWHHACSFSPGQSRVQTNTSGHCRKWKKRETPLNTRPSVRIQRLEREEQTPSVI